MTNNAMTTMADMRKDLSDGSDADLTDNEVAAAALAAMAAKNGGQNRSYLLFDTKSGLMSYKNGDKKVVLPDTVKLAVNILGVKQVLSCWVGGKVVDKVEVAFHEDLPDVDTLPMHGIDVEGCAKDDKCLDGWSESISIPVRDIESGKEFDFLAPNMTTKNAAGRLMQTLSEEVVLYDIATYMPIITVDQSTYKSREGYTVYAPKFEVEEWVEQDSIGNKAQKALPKKKK